MDWQQASPHIQHTAIKIRTNFDIKITSNSLNYFRKYRITFPHTFV